MISKASESVYCNTYCIILKSYFSGDDLYPSNVEYNNGDIKAEETVLELRERAKVLHRYESFGSVKQFIIKNLKSDHIDMGDRIIPVIA